MAKTDKKSAKQVIKKKKWVTIFAPKSMGETPLGESYLEDTSVVEGRVVKINLMQITGDVKNQNAEVKFEITGGKDNKLETKIIGYYFSPGTIRRFMRRHTSRVDDALILLTQDGVKIRIKPFALTKSKVTKSVEYTLRLTMKEEIMNMVKKTPYEALFMSVLKYQLQKELREKLSKIYPIKNLEIRILEEETNPTVKETAPPVKKAVRKTKAKKEKPQEEEIEHKEDTSGNQSGEEKPAEEKLE
jgi:small subunit ribosomal protein S3Ae